FKDSQNALFGDYLADWAGDRLYRMGKGVLMAQAMRNMPAIERLRDAVNGAQQNAPFAKNIGFVFAFQRRLENDRRTNGYRPTQRVIGGFAIDVLMDGETGIDACAVDTLALFIQTAHRRPHAFGADADDIDVLGEIIAHIT